MRADNWHFASFLLLEVVLTLSSGFPISHSPGNRVPKLLSLREASGADPLFLRSDFNSVAARAVLFPFVLFPSVAGAREIEASLKGTKKDPQFEACLSRCVYECTKAKGSEQRGRSECLPECKASCATTKEQRLIGKPINSE